MANMRAGEEQEKQVQKVVVVVEEEEENKVMDVSLNLLSLKLKEFAKARDWKEYHTPRNLLLAMV